MSRAGRPWPRTSIFSCPLKTTRVIEAGEGPEVLFVRGFGARADRWRTTVERIANLDQPTGLLVPPAP